MHLLCQFRLASVPCQVDCFSSDADRIAEPADPGVGGGQHVQGLRLLVARDLTKPLCERHRLGRVTNILVPVRGQEPGQLAECGRPVRFQPHRLPVLGDGLGNLALIRQRDSQAAAHLGHIWVDLQGLFRSA